MSETRRVLVVGPAPGGKGGISEVMSWYASLADTLPGYAVDVAASHPGERQRTLGSALASIRESRQVVRRIRRERPDIVHVLTGPRGSLLRKMRIAAAANKAGSRVVLHIHSGTVERTLMGEATPDAPAKTVRRLLAQASVVGTLWHGPREGMRRFGQGAIWLQCGNAVSCPPFDAASPRDIDVVFVGRVTADKGAEHLAALGAELSAAGIGLAVVGEAGDASGAECLEELRHVEGAEILGWLPRADVSGILARARVLVLPSRHEALPMAALEAMAAGCVVVARGVGALPLMLDDGQGVVIEGTAGEWTAAIKRLIDEEPARARMAEAAHAFVERHYSEKTVRQQVAAMYDAAVRDIGMRAGVCENGRVDVLGYCADAVTLEEACTRAADAAMRGESGDCVCLNASKLVNAQAIHVLRVYLANPLLSLADGASVVWASRVLRRPLPERVTGIDFGEGLVGECEKQGLPVFFLGGSAETLESVLGWAGGRFPRLPVVGAQHGYYKDPDGVARTIVESGAQVLLIGMTSPLANAFTVNFPEVGSACVSVVVGGSFEVWAGNVKRAPAAFQRMGLEWVYRLVQEPRRLFWRYLRTNPTFVVRVLAQRVSEQWAGRNG